MDYKVVVTKDAEEDLERFIKYLIFEKKSLQAAENVLNDYDVTIESLRHVAGSLKLCDNPRLRQLKYRRILKMLKCCIVREMQVKKIDIKKLSKKYSVRKILVAERQL